MLAVFRTYPLSRSLLTLAIFLTASLPHVHSAPLPLNLPSWLEDMIPQKGVTIAEEIKCYSLPYGAIGFVSHILTYWTICWLSFGRRPYWPGSRLSAGKLDLVLSFIQLTITVGLASFTIVRCRSRWQFILLAVWKLTMSATVGFWGIWASVKAMKNKGIAYDSVKKADDGDEKKPYSTFGYNALTLLIYFLSMTVGLVGTISLVAENIHQAEVWKITVVFASIVAFFGVVALLVGAAGDDSSCFGATATSVFGVIPGFMLVLGAFYCDWILAALAGSLVGVPSGDTAILYWTYFGAKRIPLFLT